MEGSTSPRINGVSHQSINPLRTETRLQDTLHAGHASVSKASMRDYSIVKPKNIRAPSSSPWAANDGPHGDNSPNGPFAGALIMAHTSLMLRNQFWPAWSRWSRSFGCLSTSAGL